MAAIIRQHPRKLVAGIVLIFYLRPTLSYTDSSIHLFIHPYQYHSLQITKKILTGKAGAGYGIAEDILPNPFRTYGVQNIEKRYSAGGGSKNHQPGVSSGRGDHEAVTGNQEKAKGIGSPHHEEHIQPQKPDVSAL